MKRMCLSQANADLAEAAEKLESIRRKLAVSFLDFFWIHILFNVVKAPHMSQYLRDNIIAASRVISFPFS